MRPGRRLLAMLLLSSLTSGCAHFASHGSPGGDGASCARGGPLQRGLHEHFTRQAPQYGGPMSPTVTYPYYTTRGPRDFLADHPRTPGR